MLIAIVATLLVVMLCGRSSSMAVDYHHTEDLITKTVSDEPRRKQAMEIVDQMEKVAKGSAQEWRKSTESLQKVLDVRTSSNDQILMALQPLVDEDQATANKLLDLRFELKSVLTAEEWAEVFPAPTTMPSGAMRP
jgi:predicted GTPase